MKTYTEAEYRALEQENIIWLKKVERLELNERINLKMIGDDLRFRFKIVKTLLAMSRHLNLLPDARQSGFFYEDASLNDIADFAEKCLARLKVAHNRDTLIENLGKEKVQWQETAESLDSAVNHARKAFEDIKIWMGSLCLALGISLGDLKKGNLTTSQTISAAIKNLIHEKAQLEKEADWLAMELEKREHGCEWCCCKTSCSRHLTPCGYTGPHNWRNAARKAVEEQCKNN